MSPSRASRVKGRAKRQLNSAAEQEVNELILPRPSVILTKRALRHFSEFIPYPKQHQTGGRSVLETSKAPGTEVEGLEIHL